MFLRLIRNITQLAPQNSSLMWKLNNFPLEEKDNIRYLGVLIDKSMKFTKHIEHISGIIGRNIGIISRVRFYIDKKTTYLLYNSLILARTWTIAVWYGALIIIHSLLD